MDRPSDRESDPLGDEVVLPADSVAVDPVLADAVEDALAGPPLASGSLDPDRVLGADPHDFAGLYIRHRSSFSLHARRFLRDQRDVDEVVQEAFLRLFLALPELDSELQALAYCRRTITNLCIDRYRADQRRPRLVDLDSVPIDALPGDEAEDPVVRAEDAAVVREALSLLSPVHRAALVKREIEEKSLPVIAVELDVPEDTVKHLLHRARKALRKRLAETHLARGVDLDDVSTLSLLARSAASGGSRLGVLVLLLAGLAAGASSSVDSTPLGGLWDDEPVVERTAPRSPSAAVEPQAEVPPPQPPTDGVLPGVPGADRDFPGPAAYPAEPAVPAAPVPPPLPAAAVAPVLPASGTVSASPSDVPTAGSVDRPATPAVVAPVEVPTASTAAPAAAPAAAPTAAPTSAPTAASAKPSASAEPTTRPTPPSPPTQRPSPSSTPIPRPTPSAASSSSAVPLSPTVPATATAPVERSKVKQKPEGKEIEVKQQPEGEQELEQEPREAVPAAAAPAASPPQ